MLETLFKTFSNIVMDHAAKYSPFEINDLYKLVHQAAMGPAHIFTTLSDAEAAIAVEWVDMGKAVRGEPLMEIIDPRSRLVRVNLRVYQGMGGTIMDMANMLRTSAQTYTGDSATFLLYTEYVMKLSAQGKLPFSEEQAGDFWKAMEKSGFRAVHHSKAYTEAHRPCYRVVLQELLF